MSSRTCFAVLDSLLTVIPSLRGIPAPLDTAQPVLGKYRFAEDSSSVGMTTHLWIEGLQPVRDSH